MAGEQTSLSQPSSVQTNGTAGRDLAELDCNKDNQKDDDKQQAVDIVSDLHCFFPSGKTLMTTPSLSVTTDMFRLWHGAGGDKLTIQFVENSEQFELPQEALIASFDYFRSMLNPRGVLSFSEVTDRTVHFANMIDPYDFGVLITWLQTGLLKMPRNGNLAVTRCISTIIAADYLQMIRIERYVEDVKAWLEDYLGADRKVLSADHLQLMQRHSEIFQKKAKAIGILAAKAAVRPFLTGHLDHIPGKATTEWAGDSPHFMALMKNDAEYAFNVMMQVRHTLHTAKRRNKARLMSTVTICQANGTSTGYDCFDIVQYWDPLLSSSPSHSHKAAFTI